MSEEFENKREKAMLYWHSLPYFDHYEKSKCSLAYDYYGKRPPDSLTGREIQIIWEKELQEESMNFEYRIMDDVSNYPDEQVDFDMLKRVVMDLSNMRAIYPSLISVDWYNSHIKNIDNFLKQLGKNRSFAKKAHFELKK